jgi:hypothetical protein
MFVKIERPTSSSDGKPVASASLIKRKGAPPALQITLRRPFLEASQIPDDVRFDLFVGTLNYAGLIRFKKAADGAFSGRITPRGAAMIIHCGHIPQLGLEAREREAVDANLVANDTIEIVLPKWEERPGRPVNPGMDRSDRAGVVKQTGR